MKLIDYNYHGLYYDLLTRVDLCKYILLRLSTVRQLRHLDTTGHRLRNAATAET